MSSFKRTLKPFHDVTLTLLLLAGVKQTNKCFTTMELLNECQMHIQSQINTQEYNYLLRTSGSVDLVVNLAGFLEFLFF